MRRIEIQDASAWVLRAGVIASVAVMLLGLARSFAQGMTLAQMESARFSSNFGALARGCLAFDGLPLVELGILLLVLTPILRVATSMVLFAVEERDGFYTGVTFLVLALSLVSLLILS